MPFDLIHCVSMIKISDCRFDVVVAIMFEFVFSFIFWLKVCIKFVCNKFFDFKLSKAF